VVPVSRLIDELWGDDPPASARKTVQIYVSRLRTALGSDRLQSSAGGYRLVAGDEEIDTLEFIRLVAAGNLDQALEMWRGPALTGLEFVPALAGEAERLEQARADAIEQRIDVALAAGEHGRLVPQLECLVRERPLREPLRARLMLALYRSGRQAEALEVYRDGRMLLDELGLEPTENLRELERRILTHDPTLAVHRFERAAAERAGQLGNGDVALLRSLHRTNLPVPPTPFLGRQRELAEVAALACDHGVRLVTVSGAGGIGKTRLGLQAARELAAENPEGVFWVPLASLRDPELVLPAVARALGATQELRAHIGDRRLLILLDNFEHVLDAAPALGTLLSSCPRLKLLVTSRERLGIAGEHEYALSTLTDADGQQLFTERARALDSHFVPTAAVAELCRRLDNLPLALELAAAGTKLFSAEQLVERLPQRLDLLRGGRDADARQRTLRATIDWSHDLLDAGERQLFARLSVFAGGCTLKAAEAVCGADPERLASLIDKSLLRRRQGEAGEGRFWMLETIREYALERLDESTDAEELRRRHAIFFFDLAATARDAHGSGAWLDRFSAEIDNLRGVLAWSLDNAVGEGLRFAAALYRLWSVRGHGHELARWFDAAFQCAEPVPAEVRMQALETDGHIHRFLLDDNERARELYDEGLRLARDLGDERAEAWFFMLGGTISDDDLEQALRRFEQALEMFQRIGDGRGAAMALNNTGGMLCHLGKFDHAAERFEEALAIWESLGDRWGVSCAIGGLADVALHQCHLQRASDRYRESLAISIELDDKRSIAYGLAGLSCAAALSGELSRAGTLWAAAELFEDAYGSRMMASERARYECLLVEGKGAPAFVTAFERGHQLTLERALEHALARVNVDGPGEARRPEIAPSS
jgi:predicted ATPase/DNA-binding SARP family transcriptional activator